MHQESWLSKNRIAIIAMFISFVYHGSLLLFGTYRRTYDAYVHIFFADHYARWWWDPWDIRWYTGFPLTSYPPFSHQATALLSKFLGLELAFAVVFLFGMVALTLGIYRFARLWVDDEAAGAAALLTTFSSSIAITIHVFGQLPTILSLSMLTNALPFVYQWVDRGKPYDLIRAWSFTAATTAAHHVTTLFGAVFFMGPIFATVIFSHFRTPRIDETDWQTEVITLQNFQSLIWRRIKRIVPSVFRSGVFGVGLIILLLLVVFPYWYWSSTDPITQVSIPHASRDSFIENPNAGLMFWLLPYGMLLFVLPYAFYKGYTTKNWIMSMSLWLLFLLGTGGTTPIPRMLLGGAFDILTLDRFTFWATIWLLPFAGLFVVSLLKGRLRSWILGNFNIVVLRLVQLFIIGGFLFMSAFSANLTQFRKFQPAFVDPTPIVDFLEKDEHWRWRYLTLGMGDQMAWLSAQTTASQIDGNYHSARRLPELTTTPVERLEGAKFRGIPGIGSLEQFITIPDKYNIKFIFSNDEFYDPLLYFAGWARLVRLGNGIMVWERQDTPPMPAQPPRKYIPGYQRLMWGILPTAAFLNAMFMASLKLFFPLFNRLEARYQLKPKIKRVTQRLYRGMSWVLSRCCKRRAKGLQTKLIWVWDLIFPRVNDDHPPIEAGEEDWQIWRRITDLIPALNIGVKSLPRRVVQSTALLVMVIILTGLGYSTWRTESSSPRKTLEAYYDDLDFKRFPQSYQYLAQASDITMDEYLLGLSIQGGLIASYSKLDSLYITELSRESSVAKMVVTAEYITALNEYSATKTITLVKEENQWKILYPKPIYQLPAETIYTRPDLAWGLQSRRQIIPVSNPFKDLLDRPELQIISSRMVFYDGKVSVVGELINLDTVPADLTVTALLRDKNGHKITQYNAKDIIIHKILPKEITPFRVDFIGVVSGTTAAAITPSPAEEALTSGHEEETLLEITPELLAKNIGSYEVYAKAVITTQNLDRNLGFYNHAWDGRGISGQISNVGTVEIAIPHLLLTLYDEQGRVAWVEQSYQESSIRAQQQKPFNFNVPTPDAVITIFDDRRGTMYGPGWNPNFGPDPNATGIHTLPTEQTGEYAGYRLTGNYLLLTGM